MARDSTKENSCRTLPTVAVPVISTSADKEKSLVEPGVMSEPTFTVPTDRSTVSEWTSTSL